MTKHALVVGGTSGLGLEMAKRLTQNYEVSVSGRSRISIREGIKHVCPFDLELANPDFVLRSFLEECPSVDLLVYAVGHRQVSGLGSIYNDRNNIAGLVKTGLTIPAILISGLLRRGGKLPGLIVVTSTSEWTPRLGEEVYCATKAGLGMLANSISLDPRVGKTMVLAPAGMNTKFWDGDGRDTSNYLDPQWVAEQGMKQFAGAFRYKHVKILRGPPRIEVGEHH